MIRISLLILMLGIFGAALIPLKVCAQKVPVKKPGPPVSKIKQQVDAMVAKTKPGYYKALLDANRKVNLLSDARTSATQDCAATLCRSSAPLPVTLINFSGKRLDYSQIQLNWTTSSEVNNDHFEIERTSNPANGFQTAGTVKGNINSSQNSVYQFVDPNKETAYTYYRLRQVDLDGTSTYSQIIGIKGFSAELAVAAFPNPGTGKELKFQVSGMQNQQDFNVSLFDIKGRSVYKREHYILPDSQLISVPELSLEPGSYVIKITGSQQEASSSFFVVR